MLRTFDQLAKQGQIRAKLKKAAEAINIKLEDFEGTRYGHMILIPF